MYFYSVICIFIYLILHSGLIQKIIATIINPIELSTQQKVMITSNMVVAKNIKKINKYFLRLALGCKFFDFFLY
jgi:hypothetical protein